MQQRRKGSRLSGQIKTLQHRARYPIAAVAAEWKYVSQGRVGMLLKRLLQEFACTMQAGFDGFDAEPKEIRGLLHAHFLDKTRNQHGSKGLGQIVDGLFEQVLDLSLSHGAFRIKLRGGRLEWNDLTL